jgi:hypothetical protein
MTQELAIIRDGKGQARVSNFGREPDWRMPITFLIHGYNVDPEGAASAYERLFSTSGMKTLPPPLLESRRWLVYWEGYASGGLATGKTILSPLTYAAQIPSACAAARALRQYIDQKSGGRAEVYLIAHSLGCRLALELLDQYAMMPSGAVPNFPAVVLMAAAVPTHFFEDLKRLWKGALLPGRVVVMFSESDWVLKVPFRAGQTYAGEGLFPKAVGATGGPAGYWARVVRTRNGHSGYFGDPKARAEIASAMGDARPVELPTFAGGAMISDSTGRSLPQSALPSRATRGERR